MGKNKKAARWYLGVDVGGTKILAALAKPGGRILARKRAPTPRSADPEDTCAAVCGLVTEVLAEAGVGRTGLRAMGIAVPGIVDPYEGKVIFTPNMNLSGFSMAPRLEEEFGVPIALGNDVNLGTLGEQWLGAASLADSAVGIFVGTGIGGGIIIGGKLLAGHRGMAAEVGHMRVREDGPACGCGAHGCLEALASRTAIERDLREAVAAGRKTILTDLAGQDFSVIRSSVLRRALADNDELVKEVMARAAHTLALACVQIRHLLDPEVIILGGGVIEACKFFILPILQEAMAQDPMGKVLPGGRVVVAALGDNAVVLGAVALAQQQLGRDPLAKVRRAARRYPTIAAVDADAGTVTVDCVTYDKDIYIRVDGKVGKRSKARRKDQSAPPNAIATAELKRVCKGDPSILIIGAGTSGTAALTADAEQFLRKRGITYETLPNRQAADAYNAVRGRKAALIHLGG